MLVEAVKNNLYQIKLLGRWLPERKTRDLLSLLISSFVEIGKLLVHPIFNEYCAMKRGQFHHRR